MKQGDLLNWIPGSTLKLWLQFWSRTTRIPSQSPISSTHGFLLETVPLIAIFGYMYPRLWTHKETTGDNCTNRVHPDLLNTGCQIFLVSKLSLRCFLLVTLFILCTATVTVTRWYRIKRPKHWCHYYFIVFPHLNVVSPDSCTLAVISRDA
jgi:hypothetical protein